MAGKTGTAQKVANGRYDPTKWVSSFVGIVPADDPRLVISVVVDEPQGSHLGGAWRRRLQGDRGAGAALPARRADGVSWRRVARTQARARPATNRRRPGRGRSKISH